MSKEKGSGPVNLLTLKPRRMAEWENGEDDSVAILVPRFGNGRVGRFFSSRLSRPNIRVKLDEHGSYLWKRCDGNTTVADLAQAMQQQFGGELVSWYNRISDYLNTLERGDLLGVDNHTNQ